MRKSLITVAALALLAGGTVSAGAMDLTDLSTSGIRSNTAATPTITAGGGQFFPVVNTFQSGDTSLGSSPNQSKSVIKCVNLQPILIPRKRNAAPSKSRRRILERFTN